MEIGSVIETGVDKLVELVKKKGEVSFSDAAKELGVSLDVVTEWADFLNEEGILSVEYKFTKPYLLDKKVNKGEIEKKAREFSDKKEIFVRKAEGALSVLKREEGNMEKIKEELSDIKKELGSELDSVKREINELQKVAEEKDKITQKIVSEKIEADKKTAELTSTIAKEQKKLADVLSQIRKEEENLEKEKKDANSLEEKEKKLMLEMMSVKNMVKEVEEKVSHEGASIKASTQHIEALRAAAQEIERHLKNEKDSIEPLLKKKEEHEKTIKDLHSKIIEGVKGAKKGDGKSKAAERMKQFFDKHLKVWPIIEKLNEDRAALEKELNELVKKAKAFQLSSKGKDLDKEVKEIEEKFKSVEERKGAFEEQFKKLHNLLKMG